MFAVPAWTARTAWESALDRRHASITLARTSAARVKQTEVRLDGAHQRLNESGARLARNGDLARPGRSVRNVIE
jgi:hypothetical protein